MFGEISKQRGVGTPKIWEANILKVKRKIKITFPLLVFLLFPCFKPPGIESLFGDRSFHVLLSRKHIWCVPSLICVRLLPRYQHIFEWWGDMGNAYHKWFGHKLLYDH